MEDHSNCRPCEWSRELDVLIGEEKVPTVNDLKLLGVTLDHGLNFHVHAHNMIKTLTQRNNILKVLTNPKCGLQKEELIVIYKALWRSIVSYGTLAWTLNISETNWKKLEAKQNDQLRTVTGCV